MYHFAILKQRLEKQKKTDNLGYRVGGKNLSDLKAWFKEEKDEKLVALVADGSTEALTELRGFIAQNPRNTQYLKDLRFDADALATNYYLDCQGWCLLNVAAARGKPEMVNFLVTEVGMDVNTLCYGVSPIYCCFPSIHDGADNFNEGRLEAAKSFAACGADLSHQNNFAREGYSPSGLGIIHTACHINDDELRQKALEFIIHENGARGKLADCAIIDYQGSNAADRLLNKPSKQVRPQLELLESVGVRPRSRTTNASQSASGESLLGESKSVETNLGGRK